MPAVFRLAPGYYGALDLSGNIEEFAVTSGNTAGRSFTGINGDGALTMQQAMLMKIFGRASVTIRRLHSRT
jgi:hypothetical protein